MTKYLETKNNSIEEAISSVVLGETKLDEYTLTKLDKMRGIKKGDHVFFVSGSNAEGNVYAQNEKEAMENFIRWCHKGPPGAQVNKIIEVHGETDDFREFIILY